MYGKVQMTDLSVSVCCLLSFKCEASSSFSMGWVVGQNLKLKVCEINEYFYIFSFLLEEGIGPIQINIFVILIIE